MRDDITDVPEVELPDDGRRRHRRRHMSDEEVIVTTALQTEVGRIEASLERSSSRLEKQTRAMDMRKLGATYDEIAKALGFKSRTSAYYAVQRGLQKTLRESGEDLRSMLVQRLDFMLLRLQKRIMDGQPRAIEVALKIEERRARLLGLDAADKLEIKHEGPTVIEYYRDERQAPRRIQGEVIDVTPEPETRQLPPAGSSDSDAQRNDEGDRSSGRDGSGEDVDSTALG